MVALGSENIKSLDSKLLTGRGNVGTEEVLLFAVSFTSIGGQASGSWYITGD